MSSSSQALRDRAQDAHSAASVLAQASGEKEGGAAKGPPKKRRRMPPEEVLEEIAALLERTQRKFTTIFRSQEFNPGYQAPEHGEAEPEYLPKECATILERAGLEVPVDDVVFCMKMLDSDASGAISLDELEAAIRAHTRQETEVWQRDDWQTRQDPPEMPPTPVKAPTPVTPVSPPTPVSPASKREKTPPRGGSTTPRSTTPKSTTPRAGGQARLEQMSLMHTEKLLRIKEKRELVLKAEDERIANGKKLNRLGTRAKLKTEAEAANKSGERLYYDVFTRDQNLNQLIRKVEIEEQLKVNKTRVKRQGLPAQHRSTSAPGVIKEHRGHAGDRLHAMAKNSHLAKRTKQAERDFEQIQDLDKVGARAMARLEGERKVRHCSNPDCQAELTGEGAMFCNKCGTKWEPTVKQGGKQVVDRLYDDHVERQEKRMKRREEMFLEESKHQKAPPTKEELVLIRERVEELHQEQNIIQQRLAKDREVQDLRRVAALEKERKLHEEELARRKELAPRSCQNAVSKYHEQVRGKGRLCVNEECGATITEVGCEFCTKCGCHQARPIIGCRVKVISTRDAFSMEYGLVVDIQTVPTEEGDHRIDFHVRMDNLDGIEHFTEHELRVVPAHQGLKGMNKPVFGSSEKRITELAGSPTPRSARCRSSGPTPRSARSASPRFDLGGTLQSGLSSVTPRTPGEEIGKAHHALKAIRTVLDMRTTHKMEYDQNEGLTSASDSGIGFLEPHLEGMKDILRQFVEAGEESDLNGEGAANLKHLESSRLWSDSLLAESDGRRQCLEPDPIRQVTSDMDKLLEEAEKAQATLLALVGPNNLQDFVSQGYDAKFDINVQWPAGSKWAYPKACQAARFAVNPGAKDVAQAWAKAQVRFAPSEFKRAPRHVLDLARACLVFTEAKSLRQGLREVHERFEVICVRNFYQPCNQNILGHRYVEVLVVLGPIHGLSMPHVCEIQLMETSYFNAFESTKKSIDEICAAIGQYYYRSKQSQCLSWLEYLARFVLMRPKDSHPLTVFRRHLSRHYGSHVAAWRLELNNPSIVRFPAFRTVTQNLNNREQTVEFWQGLDSSLSGTISLFELHPETVTLLARFRTKLIGQCATDELATPDVLFERLISIVYQRQTKPMSASEADIKAKSFKKGSDPSKCLTEPEFARVVTWLGFKREEASLLFQYLDIQGGSRNTQANRITCADMAWLKKLPQLVNLEAVLLTPEQGMTQTDSLRLLSRMGSSNSKRSARVPTAASLKRGSQVDRDRAQLRDVCREDLGGYFNASARSNYTEDGSLSPSSTSSKGRRHSSTPRQGGDSERSQRTLEHRMTSVTERTEQDEFDVLQEVFECTHCNADLEAGAQFCAKCGKEQDVGFPTCAICGAVFEEAAAQFCRKCGHPRQESPPGEPEDDRSLGDQPSSHTAWGSEQDEPRASSTNLPVEASRPRTSSSVSFKEQVVDEGLDQGSEPSGKQAAGRASQSRRSREGNTRASDADDIGLASTAVKRGSEASMGDVEEDESEGSEEEDSDESDSF